nr:hypothetical protein OG781_39415 [Streptomyces sp. NBC_00830]
MNSGRWTGAPALDAVGTSSDSPPTANGLIAWSTYSQQALPRYELPLTTNGLPDDLRPAAQASAAVSIPGLPGVAVPDATAAVKTTRALTDSLLQAKAATLAGDKLPPAEVTQAAAKIKSARGTFDVDLRDFKWVILTNTEDASPLAMEAVQTLEVAAVQQLQVQHPDPADPGDFPDHMNLLRAFAWWET